MKSIILIISLLIGTNLYSAGPCDATPVDYEWICSHKNTHELEAEVKEKLKLGWRLHGVPIYVQYRGFCQVMVKYE